MSDLLWKFLDNSNGPMLFLMLSSGVKAALLWNASSADRRRLVGRVSRLAIYPAKSMKKVETDRLECLSQGAQLGRFGDRVFMVTEGDKHTFVTARTEPSLVMIQPHMNGSQLVLEVDGKDPLTVDLDRIENDQVIVHSGVQGVDTDGLDCGDEAGRWLDDYLKKPGHRLLYASPSLARRSVKTCSQKYMEWSAVVEEHHKVAFQDHATYHLLSDPSVESLNKKMDQPITADYFRPNIIVADCEPYSEDAWKKVYIGDAEFSSYKINNRCILVTVNPETGIKNSSLEPLKSLTRHRKIIPSLETGCIGVHLVLEREGIVRVGDPVYAIVGERRLTP